MPKKSVARKQKSNLLDFLNRNGVEFEKLGLRINNYTVSLMFLAFLGAIIASIAMKSPWPFTAVAAALGLRSIPFIFFKR